MAVRMLLGRKLVEFSDEFSYGCSAEKRIVELDRKNQESGSQEVVASEDEAATLAYVEKDHEVAQNIDDATEGDSSLTHDESNAPIEISAVESKDDSNEVGFEEAEQSDTANDGELSSTQDMSADAEPPSSQAIARRGVFLASLAGGVLAGAIGVGIGFGVSDWLRPISYEDLQERILTLESSIVAQSSQLTATTSDVLGRLDDLAGQVSTLAVEVADAENAALLSRLSTFPERLESVEAQLQEITIETGDAESKEVMRSIEEEVTTLKVSVTKLEDSLEDMLTDVVRREERAVEQERKADARAVASRILVALDHGGAIEDYISELDSLDVSIPEELAIAPNGIATLERLQSTFPDLARQALSLARGSSGETGVWAFLKEQLQMRSVTPREGAGVDAVLSRVEAELNSGNVEKALVELEAVPQIVLEEFQHWIDEAQTRVAAQTAVDRVLQDLGAE